MFLDCRRHSPNVLDTSHICNISRLSVKQLGKNKRSFTCLWDKKHYYIAYIHYTRRLEIRCVYCIRRSNSCMHSKSVKPIIRIYIKYESVVSPVVLWV
jgi:hypothetical protein